MPEMPGQPSLLKKEHATLRRGGEYLVLIHYRNLQATNVM